MNDHDDDLVNDRIETTNIARERPGIGETMRTELWEWQESIEGSLTGANCWPAHRETIQRI